MANELIGLHHVTAMTSDSQKIFDFMSRLLGLHLIKKTVNQDDLATYHLYFTDDLGDAGTVMTFFQFPNLPKGTRGTNLISRIGFRVPNDAALDYWQQRFTEHHVKYGEIVTQFDSKVLPFEDFDGQQYALISDETNHGIPAFTPFKKSDVPSEYAIVGLGPTVITILNFDHLKFILTVLMHFTQKAQKDNLTLFELNDGGHGAQIILEHREDLKPAEEGFGLVHHMAFRVKDRAVLDEWIKTIQSFRLPQSGFVERYYFESEYFRPAPQILFEIATDGPGFLQDETYETAGHHLELPPFLEPKRKAIEAGLKPIDTVL